ncbi:hypothetical protein BD410DRAFT_817578 [Rickenella mellea]|uniref:Glycosyltransferase family 32 protein n=1 Tax=Rickenella mellea TaxID=50990 RepID=A0A4R5XFC7_9AGAM|nr:hypothetical protein BD410DRAFT_817578 [Rickenella mellea]
MARRRGLQIFLSILALFLIGTVVVLSSISVYLSIDAAAYLTEDEVGHNEHGERWNATDHGKVEVIPRILHQTWKTETLPDRWKGISQECREMMPDYEYKLWTDASSREFIAKEYPWFLDTFDSYTYPIQRADAIRYFVLHFYGGIYFDLDIGCRRPLDPLLVFPVILPKTIPVGVSNDLIFSAKGHPFVAQTIHNLVTFDHSWILNYPTVMFSTGPMFLSAQYGIWTSSHLPTPEMPGGEVRILPKSLYGKNAKPEEAPHTFFSHFYGSSWHADDAAFIGFLGKWGKGLMWVGLVILVFGFARLLWQKRSKRDSTGRIGGYEVLLPRSYQRDGRWHIDLGLFTMTARGLGNIEPSSSVEDSAAHTHDEHEHEPILPVSFDVRSSSPAFSESSVGESILGNRASRRPTAVGSLIRSGMRVVSSITGSRSQDALRGRASSRRKWPNRGVLFFLPAIFTPNTQPHIELNTRRSSDEITPSRGLRSSPNVSQDNRYTDDLEEASMFGGSSSTRQVSSQRTPSPRVGSPEKSVLAAPDSVDPPPYVDSHLPPQLPRGKNSWSADGTWEEWESR